MAFPLLLLLAFAAQTPQTTAPTSEDSFAEVPLLVIEQESWRPWLDYLQPTAEESAFAQIPWHPTFADGILAANQAQRPLLLWVMNGHPLGCT